MADVMKWMRYTGFREVVFESDAQVVVRSIQGQDRDITEFGDTINLCRDLVEENPVNDLLDDYCLIAHTSIFT
ncbi:hypothetical protein LINPERPRIM_LOCUS33412 [Linum perenne]